MRIILFYVIMASMFPSFTTSLASKVDVINSHANKAKQNIKRSFPIRDTRRMSQNNQRDYQSPLQRLSPKDAAILMNSIDFLIT